MIERRPSCFSSLGVRTFSRRMVILGPLCVDHILRRVADRLRARLRARGVQPLCRRPGRRSPASARNAATSVEDGGVPQRVLEGVLYLATASLVIWAVIVVSGH